MFKVGDRIKLHKNSKYIHQCTGNGIILINEKTSGSYQWGIIWDNGHRFWYRTEDLVHNKEHTVIQILKEVDSM